MEKLITWWRLFHDTHRELLKHNPSLLAAGLSYFTVFSVIPFIVMVITIFGRVIGETQARDQLLYQIGAMFSEQTANSIGSLLNVVAHARLSAVTTVSGAILFFGASRMFNSLQAALNLIWKTEPAQKKSFVRGYLKSRAISLMMLFGIYLVMMAFFVVGIGVEGLNMWLMRVMPAASQPFLWRVFHLLFSYFFFLSLFAMVFKIIPSATVAWRDVWIGAAVTSFLFMIGRYLIILYLSFSHLQSLFGIAGSLIVILLWVYYSSHILFYGAEFTWVYAGRFGSRFGVANAAVNDLSLASK